MSAAARKRAHRAGWDAARSWVGLFGGGEGHGGEAQPPPAPGLVFPAYVPATGRGQGLRVPLGQVGIQIAGGGQLVRVVDGGKRPCKPPQDVLRGKCRGMSKEARLRQLKFVNAVDRRQVAGTIFVTLTLRGKEGTGVVESWSLIEAARRKWFKRLERFLTPRRWFALWRKEPHKSGVAHLHVLLFFLDELPHLVKEFRPWNDRAWAESVGDVSITGTACSTELLRSWNGVTAYLCKYLAKEQDLQEVETGKVWDVVHRQLVPIDLSCELVKKEIGTTFRRILRRWHQRKSASWQAKLPDENGRPRWMTVRPWVQRSRVVSVVDQLEQLRASGVRVRRRRPRLSYTADVPLWVEDVSTGRVENHGSERHTFFAGTYFLRDVDARRLLSWAESEVARRLLVQVDLPF
jgi:hypothetical protein